MYGVLIPESLYLESKVTDLSPPEVCCSGVRGSKSSRKAPLWPSWSRGWVFPDPWLLALEDREAEPTSGGGVGLISICSPLPSLFMAPSFLSLLFVCSPGSPPPQLRQRGCSVEGGDQARGQAKVGGQHRCHGAGLHWDNSSWLQAWSQLNTDPGGGGDTSQLSSAEVTCNLWSMGSGKGTVGPCINKAQGTED